jgi:hypothetical protein
MRPHLSQVMDERRVRLDRVLVATDWAIVTLMVLLGSMVWIFVAVEVGYR